MGALKAVKAHRKTVGVGLIIAVVFCAQLLPNQASAELYFTNKIATFTSVSGQAYVGARLIEADSSQLVFETNGIFGAVAFTNLSPATLARVGISQAYLDSVRVAEAKQAVAVAAQRTMLAEEQQKLANGVGLLKMNVDSVEVSDNDPIYGDVRFCRISLATGVSTGVFMARLPGPVTAFFQQRDALVRQITRLGGRIQTRWVQVATGTAQLRAAQYQVDRANAAPPIPVFSGNYASDQAVQSTVDAMQNQVNLEQVDINYANDALNNEKNRLSDMKGDLAKAESDLEALNQTQKTATAMSAVLSHYLHNGYQVMVCAPAQ